MNILSYYAWTIRASFVMRLLKSGDYEAVLEKCEAYIGKLGETPPHKRDKRWHDVMSWFLARKADALNYLGRPEEALEAARLSLEHAELAEDPASRLRALLLYGIALMAVGREEEGLKYIDEILDMTDGRLDAPSRQARAWALLQKASVLEEGYEPLVREAIRLLSGLRSFIGLGQAYYLLYEKTRDERYLEEARRHLESAGLSPEEIAKRLRGLGGSAGKS